MRCSNPACRGGCSISADRLEGEVRAALEAVLADDVWTAQFAPDGLADAEGALAAARENAAALPRKVKFSDPNFSFWKAQADLEVQEALAAVRSITVKATHAHDLPLPHELHDPAKFDAGLRAVTSVGRLVVAPGRGDDRLSYRPFTQGDDVPGVLAA
jgi:hypothetical protein